jgi:hypothetical protein
MATTRQLIWVRASLAVFVAAVASLLTCAAARAGDVYDLQRGLPTEVEDTKTTDPGAFQLEGSARYERTHDKEDELTVQPDLQYGLVEGMHVTVSLPVVAGDADKAGSGDLALGALWRLLDESRWPSLAVQGRVDLPTGRGSDGLDTAVRLIATRGLSETPARDQLHLNLEWEHNAAAAGDERHNLYLVAVGYSRQVAEKTVLVADVVRSYELAESEDSTVIEVGVLQQLSDSLTVSGGLGAGLSEESPKLRFLLGVQYAF